MAFTEDIAEFMDTDTGFAENVVYDGTSTVAAIYSAPGADAFNIGATLPELTVASGDVAADPRGKSIVRGTTTYTVREFTPDLTGRLYSLKLEAA